jgi:hypothetical protein
MKPKKCDGCLYLYRHQLVNLKKIFQLVTATGRTKQQYMCKKADKLCFEAREKCEGPYKEAGT